MSRKHCNNNSSCCNPCNGSDNIGLGGGGSLFYILAILLIFGSGNQGGFWSDYDKVFRCSGFNNAWCANSGANNLSNSGLNTSNYNVASNTTTNSNSSNVSNTNLATLLGGLSENSNIDFSSFFDSSK